MKIGSIFVGFLLGFATYFVILQCITPSEYGYAKKLADKEALIYRKDREIERYKADAEFYQKCYDMQSEYIECYIKGKECELQHRMKQIYTY